MGKNLLIRHYLDSGTQSACLLSSGFQKITYRHFLTNALSGSIPGGRRKPFDREDSREDSKLPKEVAAIRRELSAFLNQEDAKGRKIGSAKHGIYAFFDYDEEPIYTGQTYESLRSRIGRHLTNQRTDAVAMSVLDPFEVAFVEVWPLDDLIDASAPVDAV